MVAINRIITHVRRLKTEKQLSLKCRWLRLLSMKMDDNVLDLIKGQEQVLRGITHAAVIHYHAKELELESMSKKAKLGI